MDERGGNANPQSVLVAFFRVVRPEADHNENETDQRRGSRPDERIEIASVKAHLPCSTRDHDSVSRQFV